MSGWRLLATAAAAAVLCAFAPAASVQIVDDNVVLTVDGATRALTAQREVYGVAMSTDGRSVAWVVVDAYTAEEGSTNPTTLHFHDVASNRSWVLLTSSEAEEPRQNLKTFYDPTFSLDGSHVYLLAQAWENSRAVHQVNVRTRAHRFIIDANSVKVIRNGRYAGHLLVTRYVDRGAQGAWSPAFVVRPDGKEKFMVPGSGEDETAADKWLAKNGWTAS